jgi:hypothetical protein
LGHFPNQWETIKVSVTLIAPWATQIVAEAPSIVVNADGSSEPARYRCLVSEEYTSGAPAQVQAVFMHGTRICGQAKLDLVASTVEGAPAVDPPASAPGVPSGAEFRVAPDAIGPSVSVTISVWEAGQQIWTWRAAVPGGSEEGTDRIELNADGKAFADALLAVCPSLPAAQFRRRMAGIGERLWDAAPPAFREAYLHWRTVLPPGFAIQFVTDDPHVPWEMMKPADADVDHLFIEHPVARWPLQRSARRRDAYSSTNVISFVPKYSSHSALPSAKMEGEWVCATFNGTPMPATQEAFFKVLDGKHPEPVGLLHFAGHGLVDTGLSDGGIDLEDGTVSVTDVHQHQVVLGKRDGTVVVLNACEVGAGAQLLGMNTGWGAAIAAREFGGLIAPLWEVQDDIALSMVKEALPPLLDGTASLGEALKIARAASCDRSIAAFAYLAHGDVMARYPIQK